jgi:hypothetical protein
MQFNEDTAEQNAANVLLICRSFDLFSVDV